MGSIGTPITQTIPNAGAAGPAYASTVNAFLTEVKTRLEAKVPFSSILGSGGALDANNQGLANVNYLQLYALVGAPTTPNLSLQTYNGDLYWVTTSGVLKMTSGAALNAAGISGIGGDYGGSNPAALNFVDSTNQYSFYDDVGGNVWAYLRAKGLRTVSTASAAFDCLVQFSGGASYTLTLPSAVPAATSVVMMDASGNLSVGGTAGANLTITTGGNLNLTGTADVLHAAQWEIIQPLITWLPAGFSQGGSPNGGYVTVDVGASRVFTKFLSGLRVGDVLQKCTFRWLRNSGTHTFDVGKVIDGTFTSLLSAAVTVATGAAQTTTCTLASPYTLVANEEYVMIWTPPTASMDSGRMYSQAAFVTH